MHEITAESIEGDHAFGLEFAEGDMNRPLAWPRGAQAVIGEIGQTGVMSVLSSPSDGHASAIFPAQAGLFETAYNTQELGPISDGSHCAG